MIYSIKFVEVVFFFNHSSISLGNSSKLDEKNGVTSSRKTGMTGIFQLVNLYINVGV